LLLEGDSNIAFHVKNTDAQWADPPYPGGNNLFEDPLLKGPLSGLLFGMRLAPGSPAIDHGDSSYCPDVDITGAARSGVCDAGAYEYVP
jgi:hypothetical protein